MRKLTTIIAALLISATATFAQAPQGFSYQAVVRDAQNAIVANQTVDVGVSLITIIDGLPVQTYTEHHSVKTNANGLLTLTVGRGKSKDKIADFKWDMPEAEYYIETVTDYGVSTTRLFSVPFALYAAKAAEADIDLSNYALKSDIPEAPDLSGYALKTDIPAESNLEEYAKTADIEATYAKKTDIPEAPDLSGYALKEDIPSSPDLSAYAQKSDISAVPTKVSAFENDANYLTEHQSLDDYAKKSDIPVVPTKTSDLQNDSGFLTEHQDLSAYALKADIPAKANLEGYARTTDLASYATTEALQTVDNKFANYATTTALNAKADASALDGYATTEALQTVDNKFANYATTTALNAKADASALDGYATTEALQTVDNKFANYATTTALNAKVDATALDGYATTEALQTVDNKFANYATTTALNAKADVSALDGYATTEALQTVDNKFANYATTTALNAKADASALDGYATTEALHTVDNKFANYATTTALNAKADASALDGYYSKAEVEALLTALKAKIPGMVANGIVLANGEAVDLGLTSGTLWGTCNLGASSPEEYGDYYAWGETTIKANYGWSNYKYGTSTTKLTKYCSKAANGLSGFTDALTTLEPADDAATAVLGSGWAMPASAEWNEIYNECYWVWTTNYNGTGKEGCIVYKSVDKAQDKQCTKGSTHEYSTATDTHIFLPAAGGYSGTRLYGAGSYGLYWSASFDESSPYNAYDCDVTSSLVEPLNGRNRSFGQSVRPIRRP